jgi:eukaryotic-like serine/threonine-protein kinase
MEAGGTLLHPGYRLDRYELLCPIASGGMATVWLAQLRGKRGFEKLFAVKTIKTDLTDDATFQEMFLDEARIASGIQHPNVAQILDLGEQDNVLYIVMEWVDGDSLSRIVRLAKKRGRPVPLGVALRVVSDACAGLHAAHELKDAQGLELGVVHRDVSPHNLMVSAAGSVKVIDFGVAKAKNRHAGDTREGIVKGKVRYMAPEQVHGRPMDRRADIWSMGVCLYELVTGELPFDGDDVDVVRRLMSDDAPPPPRGPVPESVELVLSRSLVRVQGARFRTAASMHRALEEAIDDIGVPAGNEDVAEFVRSACPELEKGRRETVSRALRDIKVRAKDVTATPAGASAATPEEALAPTVLSSPSVAGASPPAPSAPPTRLEKRKKALVLASVAPPPEDSKPTLRASELVKELPARRGGFVWAGILLVGAGAGAWLGWPGEARLRAAFAPTATASAQPDGVSSTPPPPPAAADGGDLALAALAALAIANDAASADASDAGADVGPDHHAGRPHHTWPSSGAPPAPAGSGVAPLPPPAPSASEAPDENNPY